MAMRHPFLVAAKPMNISYNGGHLNSAPPSGLHGRDVAPRPPLNVVRHTYRPIRSAARTNGREVSRESIRFVRSGCRRRSAKARVSQLQAKGVYRMRFLAARCLLGGRAISNEPPITNPTKSSSRRKSGPDSRPRRIADCRLAPRGSERIFCDSRQDSRFAAVATPAPDMQSESDATN